MDQPHHPEALPAITPAFLATVAQALALLQKSENPNVLAGLPAVAEQCGRLIDVSELIRSGILPVSERKARELTRRGLLPHFRIGKSVRYDARLVRAALEKNCLIEGRRAAGKAVRS
jgi:hypothetical protein